jgi:hypothetical protein
LRTNAIRSANIAPRNRDPIKTSRNSSIPSLTYSPNDLFYPPTFITISYMTKATASLKILSPKITA